ncbi:MAG: aminotransferase class V-fold PLP-dependent enzyme, partial [Candidatus Marinimicrobia bacterium]|nr:aminotransferase class V-fold PLP-dependent enzyme [Candidatus Neomarinimicrobiota bacterium]
MNKIYNFSAGPAVLDQSVLDATSKAVKEFNGLGMSLMEMSHRSKPVMDMVAETESLTRELLHIPDGYHVLFLQGGASLQFAMIPMNLLGE